MLQCPRCSNPLTVSECTCSACSRSTQITAPMVRELCSGGVIQYPTAANLQSTGQNHAYQNTGTTFKAECECVPQISGMPARHSAPCVSGTLSSIDTGPALGPPVGLQHQLSPGQPVPTMSSSMMCPTVSTSMMYPSSITRQFLLQQAKEEEQQINTKLINLQIEVLQNQLAQAKLQKEMMKSQSQAVRLQPQVPTQLVTSSMSITTPSCLSSAFSPPTPAILVAANQTPFFSNQPNLTFNVGNTWCPPTFTPPPEVPLPQVNLSEVLRNSQAELEHCCWYHGSLSWQESAMLLQNSKEGTFLVRNSQDTRFFYSLSVQRAKEGPTSVRIQFQNGHFSLDAEEQIRESMPRFKSVCELVEYYVMLGTDSYQSSSKGVLIDQKIEARKIHSPIILRQPLFKKAPTLAHFARIAINRSLAAKRDCGQASTVPKKTVETAEIKTLKLPPKLIEFLESYPLSI